MPTNRNYQSRTAAVGLDDWILEYLLTGDCEPRIKAYLWNKRLGGCLCNVYPAIWESLRDKILPEWRRAHPGQKCWAERQLEKK